MKKTIFTSLLLLFTFTLLAQDDNSVKDLPLLSKQRFYFGGGGGLSFGSVTYIEISPLVGYRITDRLSAGLQPSFSYLKYKLYTSNGNYTGRKEETYNYGGGVYGRFFILNNLFAHAQYELNSLEVYVPNNPIYSTSFERKRITVPSLLLGGGYSQAIGNKSAFSISILYDVLENPYSQYYRRPVIRAGFGIGL